MRVYKLLNILYKYNNCPECRGEKFDYNIEDNDFQLICEKCNWRKEWDNESYKREFGQFQRGPERNSLLR